MNPIVSDRVKLPFFFNAAALKKELLDVGYGEWVEHFVTQQYEGSWSIAPLRGPARARDPVQMIYVDPSCIEFTDAPLLERLHYTREVLATFRCHLASVRLMRLAPGASIKEHSDRDLAWEDGRVRLHIPVVTNSNVFFYVNGRRVILEEGECWYLRLSDPHRVVNDGQTDRVHLVIDAWVNDWLRQVLETADALAGD